VREDLTSNGNTIDNKVKNQRLAQARFIIKRKKKIIFLTKETKPRKTGSEHTF
jgi:hypothetical protein